MKECVGDFYKVASTGDVIYIGADLPSEYSGSKYTHSIRGTNSEDGKMYLYNIIDIKKETSNPIEP